MRIRRMRFGVLVTAATVLTACTSGGGADSSPSPVSASTLMGEWTLVRYTVKGHERALSAKAPGTVTFGPKSTIGADDSVNGMSGPYTIRGGVLRVGTVTSTLVGITRDSPAANTVAAIEVVLGGDGSHAVTIGQRDGRLVVSSGREQVEFRR